MSNYTHDVVATVGEYTNNAGETKKRFQKCGIVLTNEDGRMSIKLESIPVTPDWSGWLSIYPKRDREQAGAGDPFPAPASKPASRGPIPQEDNIPW